MHELTIAQQAATHVAINRKSRLKVTSPDDCRCANQGGDVAVNERQILRHQLLPLRTPLLGAVPRGAELAETIPGSADDDEIGSRVVHFSGNWYLQLAKPARLCQKQKEAESTGGLGLGTVWRLLAQAGKENDGTQNFEFG